jgi:hypothetical protein
MVMQFFSTDSAAGPSEHRPGRPIGLRTLLICAFWFGSALLITELLANSLRASHTSHSVHEYRPPSVPPSYYLDGQGRKGAN